MAVPSVNYFTSVVVNLEFAENTENLKTKMSELRLYCDLLVQQVDKTKEVATAGVADSEVKSCFSAVTDIIHKGSIWLSMGIYSPGIAILESAVLQKNMAKFNTELHALLYLEAHTFLPLKEFRTNL